MKLSPDFVKVLMTVAGFVASAAAIQWPQFSVPLVGLAGYLGGAAWHPRPGDVKALPPSGTFSDR